MRRRVNLMKIKRVQPRGILDSLIWHMFLYGYPGCGKSKVAADFHNAGLPMVIVSTYERDLTLTMEGVDAPILNPTTEDELRAIIECPETVIEKVIHPMEDDDGNRPFENYEPKLFFFDILRELQLVIFGDGGRIKDVEVFDGALSLPKSKASGILALPNARDAQGVPSNKDYRLLDVKMRGIVSRIEKMQYHTIVTAHAERDFTPQDKMQLTGDPKKDAELKIAATPQGYPSLEGFSLKKDLPGLVSDFFMYMESNGNSYTIYPKPSKGFMARTRLAGVMPPALDWTGKSAHEVLSSKLQAALKEKK
jgi:hypothetical protein